MTTETIVPVVGGPACGRELYECGDGVTIVDSLEADYKHRYELVVLGSPGCRHLAYLHCASLPMSGSECAADSEWAVGLD